MLKTTESSEKSVSRAFKTDDNEVVEIGSKTNGTVVNLSKNKKSRNLTHVSNIGATRESNFLTFATKKAFNHLGLAFIKALILRHFDLESHIRIETDALSYAIGGVSSQLNLESHALSNQ